MISGFKIVFSLMLLVVVLQTTQYLGRYQGVSGEARRKAVHTVLGLYALLFPWLFDSAWEVAGLCAAAALLLLVLRVLPILRHGVGQALYGVARNSWGEIYFVLSIALLFALSAGRPVLYVLPLLILTLSDAAAALVGTSYGRRQFVVESGRKSLEGSVVFFITAWLLAQSALLLLTDAPRAEVITVAGIVALLGALIEAASWRGLDNLFVPLGLFLLTERLLTETALAFLPAVAVFLGLMAVILAYAPRMGRVSHPLIAMLTAAFFIWLVGGVNLLAPLVVFVAHVIISRAHPDPDATLALVLGVVGLALSWFTLDRLTGYDTRLLYYLSFGIYLLILLGYGVVQARTARSPNPQ